MSTSARFSDPMSADETETLASFVTDYRWENGRRYHAYRDGAYWGPNDESACDQQDIGHHLCKVTLDNRLHLAPLQNPKSVLDLGTGTGIWAIEMADEYPDAQVTGTDLSPIQPRFVPPNCAFEIEDLNLEWTFQPGYFDFIHIRELFGCVSDWDLLFGQAFDALESGGYLEIFEHATRPVSDDETVGPDSFYTHWGDTVIEMAERTGKSFSIWKESKERLEKAGFVDVVEVKYKWPVNGWPKDPKMKNMGQWNQLRLYDGVEGMMLRLLTMTGGWPLEKAELFLEEMRKNLKNGKIHAYTEVTVVHGRKP